ncbi:MAG: copper amine oxidase N-terminal domain-containing protein [Clostridia bacterium]|nr:copper amine oxidase N-terminal domain-containing protein [Clostridia bacterium]
MAGCAAAPAGDTSPGAFTIIMQIGNPVMSVNGEKKEIDLKRGTVPIVTQDRTLLPVRAVVEEIGGVTAWDEETQTVLIGYGNDIVTLAIGSRTAYLNDKAETLDTAPVIINHRTMLPIRFIAEGFGFTVRWEEETQTITITGAEEK